MYGSNLESLGIIRHVDSLVILKTVRGEIYKAGNWTHAGRCGDVFIYAAVPNFPTCSIMVPHFIFNDLFTPE